MAAALAAACGGHGVVVFSARADVVCAVPARASLPSAMPVAHHRRLPVTGISGSTPTR